MNKLNKWQRINRAISCLYAVQSNKEDYDRMGKEWDADAEREALALLDAAIAEIELAKKAK